MTSVGVDDQELVADLADEQFDVHAAAGGGGEGGGVTRRARIRGS